MKQGTKSAICAMLILVLLCSLCLAGCKQDPKKEDGKGTELSSYKGEDKDSSGRTVYNTSLFYSNSLQQGYPDPQVLDDTERSGYYYLYGTSNFQTMRSKDLVVWEYVKVVMDFSNEKVMDVISIDRWAPEVIYDAETKLYYMFFSATPNKEREQDQIEQSGGDVDGSLTKYCMYVATSDSPEGPFTLVNFSDTSSCGEENLHSFNTDNHIELTQAQAESGEYAFVENEGKYYEAAFRQYYAPYCLFAPDELSKLFYNNKVGSGGVYNEKPTARYFQTIDPHPFVDPVSGKKYLYFKAENNAAWNINVGVEMENWLKPKWETAKYITADRFYTIADWESGSGDTVTYEFGGICNEGPHMMYHEDKNGKGLYYFAFSVNDYSTSDYQVGIAVADSPLGDFRKLREDEGGLMLCSSTTDSESVSGAGHNSFVTIGDQQYIAYHRHKDYSHPSAERYTAVDEIKWITVKDINGNDMDVPYVNGPTDSMQPLPEKVSGYKNVAPLATVTCSDSSVETEYLTDGLLPVHKSADETLMDYIRETKISKTSDFVFSFDKATSIRAIMVYNSAMRMEIFRNISQMELTLADGSVRVIKDVKFDTDQYCRMGGEGNQDVLYVLSGAAAFAEFYDIEVERIKITVEVPQGQEQVGISEIKILGSDKTGITTNNDPYTFDNNENRQHAIYDEYMKIDGKLDEQKWKEVRWLYAEDKPNDTQSAKIEFTSFIGENGIFIGAKVEEVGTNIWVNPKRGSWTNSCLELYVGPVGQLNNRSKTFEFDIQADGTTGNMRLMNPERDLHTTWNKMPVIAAQPIGGKVNTPECTGYVIECFVPWMYLKMGGWDLTNLKDIKIGIDPAHIFSLKYDGEDVSSQITETRIWSRWSEKVLPKIGWLEPDTFFRFDQNGLMLYNYAVTYSGEGKGVVESKNGMDAIYGWGTSTFVVRPRNGAVVKSLVVNGVDYMGKLRDNNGSYEFDVTDPTGDLTIQVEFGF